MRKYAGIFIAVLMLVVPALANAFTLTVQVRGGNATLGNTVVATDTSNAVVKTFTGGTNYLYPATATTLTVNTNANYTVLVNGAAYAAPIVVSSTTTVLVAYTAPLTTSASITQSAGGLVYMDLSNSTTSTVGANNVATGTNLPTTAQANAGYVITKVKFGNYSAFALTATRTSAKNVIAAGANNVVGLMTLDALAANNVASATFAKIADTSTTNLVSANLLTPLAGYTGDPVKCAAASTDPNATYVFSVTLAADGSSVTGGTQTGASYSFTPLDAAIVAPAKFVDYVVHLNVNGLDKPSLDRTVRVTSKAVYAVSQCTSCHSTSTPKVVADFNGAGHMNSGRLTGNAKVCSTCHSAAPHDNKGASCLGCHAVAQNTGAGFVQDNNGVRAITGEFTKWSHHVTGVALQDAHCAACHLEGKAVNGKIVVDDTRHMAGASTWLRNADDDTPFEWNPEEPNFTNMDNFCMSCHDADGATSAMSASIRAIMTPAPGKTASASNPFGDTISNQYDLEERPAVVDAAGQFNSTNNSHHAVRGKKYTGRSRAINGGTIADSVFTNNSGSGLGADATAGKYPGKRSTIYDAGKFETKYITLANSNAVEVSVDGIPRNGGSTLGDDSTLHCGDCHTVGQFAAPGSKAFANMSSVVHQAGKTITTNYKAAIGAHGSNNEYLLRNNIGTDEKHIGRKTDTTGAAGFDFSQTQPYLVCFNCHVDTVYDKDGDGTAHAGERTATQSACNMPQNTNTVKQSGEGRLGSYWNANGFVGVPSTEGTPDDATKAVVTFSNVFGIQCNNCHNSGISAGNIFGGIHGSKDQTYTNGMGNTTKHRRFMPGLGNTMFVPGTKGGFTGGSQATYTNYSGNRNGTTAATTAPAIGAAKCGYDGKQACTDQAAVDAWVAMDQFKKTGQKNQTFTAMPVRNNSYVQPAAPPNAGPPVFFVAPIAPSYTYTTGGVSNDLNWEQWKSQPVAGYTDPVANAMGCYTLSPGGNKVNFLKTGGYPADDKRLAATDGQKGPDGREMFDNWGGCDDHNGAQGKGTSPTRNVLRPATY